MVTSACDCQVFLVSTDMIEEMNEVKETFNAEREERTKAEEELKEVLWHEHSRQLISEHAHFSFRRGCQLSWFRIWS